VIAGALRALLLPLDGRLQALRLPERSRRTVFGAAAALAAVVAVAAAVAFDAPDRLSHQYDRFVQGDTVSSRGDLTQRLTDPGNNGRIDLWNVSLDSLKLAPLHGTGAGTFPLEWERNRPIPGNVREGHSLYLEMGGELGLVGLGLVIAALAAIGIGLARRVRRPDRDLYGVALAAFVTWALHAAVDWDWEMPVLCVWLFALGGAALAAQPRATLAPRAPGNSARIAVAIALLVLAVTPGLMWLSQHRLDNAVSAWRHGDCAQTIDYALGANRALSARPEPFVLIGYCDARLGKPEIGVTALRNAVRRDPDNWEHHYGLALVQAVAGQDPRPEAAEALRLNPKSPLAQAAVKSFRGPRDDWERRARALPLGVQ
jgi:hypothetical protein